MKIKYARVIGEEISMFLDVTSHPYNILTLKLDNTYYYQDYWHVILFLSVTIFINQMPLMQANFFWNCDVEISLS